MELIAANQSDLTLGAMLSTKSAKGGPFAQSKSSRYGSELPAMIP